MEFVHKDHDPKAPVDQIRVNWTYRTRDLYRKQLDNRLNFATMNSDFCPLSSLRGKCTVKHVSEIDDLEAFRKLPDSFFFSQLFHRYLQRYYDVIATSKVINVPGNVKKVLDKHWRFVLTEVGRSKELTSAAKLCKRCSGYCSKYDRCTYEIP